MKKIVCILISALLVIALAVSAWLWAYHHRKSNDNLPSLASLSQMTEEEITELLTGYRQAQLHEVWGSRMVPCSACSAKSGSWTGHTSTFISTMAAPWSWQGYI